MFVDDGQARLLNPGAQIHMSPLDWSVPWPGSHGQEDAVEDCELSRRGKE